MRSPGSAAGPPPTWAGSVCTMGYRWNLDYAVDVRGNARSVYGVFAIGVGGVTLLLLIGLLIRLAAHRLPENREIQAYLFPTFDAGLQAMHDIAESDATPSIWCPP